MLYLYFKIKLACSFTQLLNNNLVFQTAIIFPLPKKTKKKFERNELNIFHVEEKKILCYNWKTTKTNWFLWRIKMKKYTSRDILARGVAQLNMY